MKFVVAFLFAVVALGNSKKCPQLRSCLRELPESLPTYHSTNCMILEMSILCIEENKNTCEETDEVEEVTKFAKKIYKDVCPSGDDLDECFRLNKHYFDECLMEGQSQALQAHYEKGGAGDGDELECTMYSLMANCIVDRTGEKCGKLAAELTKEELNDLPKEIEDSCERANVINIHSLQLLK